MEELLFCPLSCYWKSQCRISTIISATSQCTEAECNFIFPLNISVVFHTQITVLSAQEDKQADLVPR